METHDMVGYWNKGQIHSWVPGQDTQLNDQADALAKQGSLNAALWTFSPDSIQGNNSSSHPPLPSLPYHLCQHSIWQSHYMLTIDGARTACQSENPAAPRAMILTLFLFSLQFSVGMFSLFCVVDKLANLNYA